MNRPRILALVAALALAGGCGGPGSTTPGTPAASAPAPSTTASPKSELFGSWTSTLTRQQVTRTLQAAGLGKWAVTFFEVEEFGPKMTWIYTFGPSAFSGAYEQSDGTWRVAWKGTMSLDGDQVVFHDVDLGADEIFRWEVTDGRLRLHFVSNASTAPFKGLPAQVFDIAYMTSAPFARTTCDRANNYCS